MINTKNQNLKIILQQIKEDLSSKRKPIIQQNYNLREEKLLIQAIAKKLARTKFVFDDYNSAVFTQLIKYFNGNPEFEKNGNKLHKGLLIAGKIGSGKSIMLRIFKEYCFYRKLPHQFRIDFSDNITDKFARYGYEGINLYLENSSSNNYGIHTQKPVNICIDDLGVEKESVKHFGSEETVIEKILASRYNLFQTGIITHATTNLDAKMLQEKYGERLYSRFKEMFNLIILQGGDRRE